MDLTELALLAGSGDAEAFGELYNKEQAVVSKWVARRAFSNDRDDIEQDIWLHLWKSLPNFKGNSDFVTWFYSLMRNRYAQFVHKNSTYRKYVSMVVRDDKYIHEMDYSDDLIATLPLKSWRDAVRGYYILGLQFVEIGKMTGESPEAIRSRCRRGIKWLQAHPHLY